MHVVMINGSPRVSKYSNTEKLFVHLKEDLLVMV